MDNNEINNPILGNNKNKIKNRKVGKLWDVQASLLFAVKKEKLGGFYE